MIPAAVALATGLAAPALAQDSDSSATTQSLSVPSAPSAVDAVGPAQLKDFSLQGTVTRRAETPAQPDVRPQPQPRQEVPAVSADAQPPARTPAPSRTAARDTLTPTPAPARTAAPSATTGLPSPDQTLSFSPATLSPQTVDSSQTTPLEPAGRNVGEGFGTYWPWLLALLAAVGAAAWYFRRPRSGYAFAGAGGDSSGFDLSPAPPAAAPPRQQPRPAAPQPAASPPPAPLAESPPLKGAVVSTRLKAAPEVRPEERVASPAPGIISARLRPWLDIEFAPLTATFNEMQAVIHFDVTLFNSGSAPARGILLEARLFNAGDDQDEAIARYFANPTVDGDRLEVISPLQRMAFRTSATVPREQMRIFEAAGRKVWVPLIGFNASYGWSSGEGQTSASYLLGRNTAGEKMAPFRVDLGARTFDGLGAHEHHVRVRS